MGYIKKLYGRIIAQSWHLGFVKNGWDGVFSTNPEYVWVKNPYHDRWFADPFILDVTDDYIFVLVEEFRYTTQVGRIAKLTINRSTMTIENVQIILEQSTHLSFPNIMRKDGHIYVYPENGKSGKLVLYELIDSKLVYVRDICEDKLADAVITDVFGRTQMFATKYPNYNGNQLLVYELVKDVFVQKDMVMFDDMHARMAGQFFIYHDKIYRPAQDCNSVYGGAIIIEECKNCNERVDFISIKQLVSKHPKYNQGMHTLNEYKGVVVVDVIGYNHNVLGKWLHNLMLKRK